MSYKLPYLKKNIRKLSFLIYGLGSTGSSTINYFKKKNFSNYSAWDDNLRIRKKFSSKITKNLKKELMSVDYIVLSPGISLNKVKFKKDLEKFKKKIITDIDLFYMENNALKTIVVTGSNGKSTTCKMIAHLLKKNKVNVKLGGNIGTPVLSLKVKRNIFFVIEASSFQLSYSKFIHPNYAMLLNISNDHVEWHGSMAKYKNSKFKIFSLQQNKNFAIIHKDLKKTFKRKKYLSKVIPIKSDDYEKIKFKIKNDYLKSSANDENMSFVFTLAKLFKIKNKSFIRIMSSFTGLPHRYETFLRKKNITFINDSKATSFQAAKKSLLSRKNIYWIVGGLPKYKDKFDLNHLSRNIVKAYIIGKNINFFKNQLKKKVKVSVTRNLKNTIISILKDIKLFKKNENTILLSPCAASFDQFKNFENRGNDFKKLSRLYAKKFI